MKFKITRTGISRQNLAQDRAFWRDLLARRASSRGLPAHNSGGYRNRRFAIIRELFDKRRGRFFAGHHGQELVEVPRPAAFGRRFDLKQIGGHKRTAVDADAALAEAVVV